MTILDHFIAVAASPTARSLRRWILHLGGVGLVPMGILDNSLLPLPGSMDIALILLCAHAKELWLYYALMATAGAVLGGFLTYRLAHRGGQKAFGRKLQSWQVGKVNDIFAQWGFGAVSLAAFLPPPVPITPFLIAAGAAQYPAKKFLAALALGRVARYMILGYVSALYGRKIIRLLAALGHPLPLAIAAIVIAAASLVLFLWRRSRDREHIAS